MKHTDFIYIYFLTHMHLQTVKFANLGIDISSTLDFILKFELTMIYEGVAY